MLLLANIGLWMWGNWYLSEPLPPQALLARSEVNATGMPVVDRKTGAELKPRKRSDHRPRTLTDVTPPRQCYRVGPFASEKRVGAVRKWLADQVVAAVPRESEKEVRTWRVYLPSQGSKKAVRETRARLDRKGFKDHAPFSEGELKNAISLGVYSVKENAEKHLKQLKKKGFKQTRLQLQQHQRRLYWLDVKTESDPGAIFVRAGWEKDGARAAAVDCAVAEQEKAVPAKAKKPGV